MTLDLNLEELERHHTGFRLREAWPFERDRYR